MASGVPARLSAAEGRKFGLTVGIAFGVLAAITWWRDHETLLKIFAGLSGTLILAGLLVPTLLGPVNRAWMGLAHLISRVTTPIFLGIVFFIVIAPIGMLMRLFGKNPLRHQPEAGSFWLSRPTERGGMNNQF